MDVSHASRRAHSGRYCRTTIPTGASRWTARRSIPREGINDVPFRGYDAHPVVTGVSNVNIVVAVQRDGHWEIKVGEFCGTAIAAWRRRRGAGRDGPVAGERHNVSPAGSFHRAHPVISGVSNRCCRRCPPQPLEERSAWPKWPNRYRRIWSVGKVCSCRLRSSNCRSYPLCEWCYFPYPRCRCCRGCQRPARKFKRFLVGWARLVVVRDVLPANCDTTLLAFFFENILEKGAAT